MSSIVVASIAQDSLTFVGSNAIKGLATDEEGTRRKVMNQKKVKPENNNFFGFCFRFETECQSK